MKRVNAKVQENRRDDPKNELDKDPNTWLIEAQLEEDLPDWERAQLHFQAPGVEAEIVEVSMTEADKFIVRTRGQSPLKKGDVIAVAIRS
jgi:hypothetical protein